MDKCTKCAESIAVAVSAAAAAISEGKTQDQIELLAVVFNQLGDTLETIAYLRQLCDNESNGDNNLNFFGYSNF